MQTSLLKIIRISRNDGRYLPKLLQVTICQQLESAQNDLRATCSRDHTGRPTVRDLEM